MREEPQPGPSEDDQTQLADEVLGSWYMTIENHIYSLCVDECGEATVDDHKYDEGEWSVLSTKYTYVISNTEVVAKPDGGAAWRAEVVVNGDLMALYGDGFTYMLTRYDGAIETLQPYFEQIEEEFPNLDITPPSQVLPGEDVNTEEQFIAATSAMYVMLRSYVASQLEIENVRLYGQTLVGEHHLIDPQSTLVEQVWTEAYKTIGMANTIIAAVNDPGFIRYKHEALAVKAFVYYNLCVLFGQTVIDEQVLSADDSLPLVVAMLNEVEMLVDEPFRVGMEDVKALCAEVALYVGDNELAVNMLSGCEANLSLYVDEVYDAELYQQFGGEITIYSPAKIELLYGEAVGDERYDEWHALGGVLYGYWSMLKRTSRAIEVCGCEPYELLLPIPMSELMFNPKITQNSGY